ncbi:hypothetical protein QQF64_002587 [Cirrhinus molitorella]|uniref:Uncharacterized protein n=1 Tax=Cirrhinus molitorella TaxID=172907 RepID=A0ABR3MQK2_9TELE
MESDVAVPSAHAFVQRCHHTWMRASLLQSVNTVMCKFEEQEVEEEYGEEEEEEKEEKEKEEADEKKEEDDDMEKKEEGQEDKCHIF